MLGTVLPRDPHLFMYLFTDDYEHLKAFMCEGFIHMRIDYESVKNREQALYNNFITNNIMGGKINFAFDFLTGNIMYSITCDFPQQFLVMCGKLKFPQ